MFLMSLTDNLRAVTMMNVVLTHQRINGVITNMIMKMKNTSRYQICNTLSICKTFHYSKTKRSLRGVYCPAVSMRNWTVLQRCFKRVFQWCPGVVSRCPITIVIDIGWTVLFSLPIWGVCPLCLHGGGFAPHPLMGADHCDNHDHPHRMIYRFGTLEHYNGVSQYGG